jgi:hypothetical protein
VVSLQQAGVGCGLATATSPRAWVGSCGAQEPGPGQIPAARRWPLARRGPAVCLMRASGMPAVSLSVMHPVDQLGNGRSGVLARFRR